MKPDIKEKFLNLFPVFKNGSPEMLEHICSSSHTASCPAKTPIYFEGDACSHIAFLLTGEIRIFKLSDKGREITLYEIGPGETCILNASCILSGSRYPAHATTLCDTEMLMVPESVLRQLINQHEEMRTFIFSLLSNRLTDVMALVEEVVFGKLDERLLDYLIEKSENNQLATTHQTIASDLGTSREVVSRLLKDFENKGQVSLSRNLIELKLCDKVT